MTGTGGQSLTILEGANEEGTFRVYTASPGPRAREENLVGLVDNDSNRGGRWRSWEVSGNDWSAIGGWSVGQPSWSGEDKEER